MPRHKKMTVTIRKQIKKSKTKKIVKMKTETVNATPKTSNLKSLAMLYGVCSKTMSRKIKSIASELGDRKGRRLYFVNEVEIIFKHFGTPKKIIPSNTDENKNDWRKKF